MAAPNPLAASLVVAVVTPTDHCLFLGLLHLPVAWRNPTDPGFPGALVVVALNPVGHDFLVASVCFAVVALSPVVHGLLAVLVWFVVVALNLVASVCFVVVALNLAASECFAVVAQSPVNHGLLVLLVCILVFALNLADYGFPEAAMGSVVFDLRPVDLNLVVRVALGPLAACAAVVASDSDHLDLDFAALTRLVCLKNDEVAISAASAAKALVHAFFCAVSA